MMKTICLLALFLVVAVSASSWRRRDLEDVHIEPLSDHMVFYINERANTTWRAERNKFHDWSLTSVKRLMGVPHNYMSHITADLDVVTHPLSGRDKIPDEFDSREQWPDCPTLREIRDQGNCGSCWAISAVETMSDRVCISTQNKVNRHLSTEDLVSCCHTCGFGCNGGFPNMAWEYFKKTGICTGGNFKSNEGCKPYSIAECEHHTTGERPPCQGESHTPKCKSACTNGNYNVTYTTDKTHGQSVYTVKSEDQIKLELMKSGPVQTAFTVYEDFVSYKSGVYKHEKGNELGGHAVKIVGWGVDNDTPYWLVANSWNTDWGDNGYFRILRGSNECGIEENVVAGLPNVEYTTD